MSKWLHANGDAGVWPRTWYAEGLTLPAPYAPLDGHHSADLCVIGAGITGLSAALHAAQAGLSVVVVEAHRVGWGASGRNGGQIGSGFNWRQERLEARIGRDAQALWTLAEDAKDLTKRLISDHAPDADVRTGVLSCCRRDADLPAYAAWAERMRRDYGTAYEVLDRNAVRARIGTEAYAGGILDLSAGYCNPLAYVLGLARAAEASGVRIFERSEVVGLGPVRTSAGRVTARSVLVAVNGYSPGLTAETGARVLPINNFIAVTEPLSAPVMAEPVAVADGQFVVNYFWQTRDNRLVYGGGESYGRRFPTDIEGKVRRNLARVYPGLAEVGISHAWGGTLAVTATRLPYVSEIADGTYAAGGYSGHGLALAGLVGKIIVEAILGDRTRLDLLEKLPAPALPGGRVLGPWAAQMGMLLGALRDRI